MRALILGSACLLALSLPATAPAQEATEDAPSAEESEVDSAEASARETLQLARLHFKRGEFARAVEAFASILATPVKLRTRRDLHEAFLYYAFTLFLQGEEEIAREKLRYGLRLDPEFAPSPVTTRPDLLAFYQAEQESFLGSNGTIAELPETIFPELQKEPGTGPVVRQQRFVPFLGIGLRQLGHPRLGNGLLVTESLSLGTNVAALILRAAYISDRTPKGMNATEISRAMTYVSFGVFWGALVTDFVTSLVLQRHYRLHPEKRRTVAATAPARRREAPRIQVAPSALTLTFW